MFSVSCRATALSVGNYFTNKLCSYNSIDADGNSSNSNINSSSCSNSSNGDNNVKIVYNRIGSNDSSSSSSSGDNNSSNSSSSGSSSNNVEMRPWKIAAQSSSQLAESDPGDYLYLPFALGCLSAGSVIGRVDTYTTTILS